MRYEEMLQFSLPNLGRGSDGVMGGTGDTWSEIGPSLLLSFPCYGEEQKKIHQNMVING